MSKNVEVAKKLLFWNSKYLIKEADLRKSDLELFFAPVFQVKANGRTYDADYDNYFDFLNQFRRTIASIRYLVGDIELLA